MILGIGMDIVEIDRIEGSLQRFGARFLQKILTPGEESALSTRGLPSASSVAARFAAKEAAVKALGTGFSQGITPQQIYVQSLPSGQPQIFFTGPAAQRMAELGATRAHLSLTHGRDSAAAVVILEA